jgi:hypothetical protein
MPVTRPSWARSDGAGSFVLKPAADYVRRPVVGELTKASWRFCRVSAKRSASTKPLGAQVETILAGCAGSAPSHAFSARFLWMSRSIKAAACTVPAASPSNAQGLTRHRDGLREPADRAGNAGAERAFSWLKLRSRARPPALRRMGSPAAVAFDQFSIRRLVCET